MGKEGGNTKAKLEFFAADPATSLELSFFDVGISAGFPSPAMDFGENKIDLNRLLIQRPSSTFFARVKGTSMQGAGIHDGDLLVIDKSIKAENNRIAVCYIDGEFTLKRLRMEKDGLYLLPENQEFTPLKVSDESNFMIWGIVIHVVKSFL